MRIGHIAPLGCSCKDFERRVTGDTRAYLDHNAASPVRPEVADAMLSALHAGGNPSSIHGEGRRARASIEKARADVAALVGAAPERVIFTSGGTEANNLALVGLHAGRPVLVGVAEHAALRESGVASNTFAVDADGVASLADIERRLDPSRPALVALQAANNETGVIQPVAEAAALASRTGSRLHCDAVQAAGRLPLDMGALSASSLALSAHKLGGPEGVGALVLAEGVELEGRLVSGGRQERGRRGGTENLAGIVGFGVAAAVAARDLAREAVRLARLRDRLESRLREVAPEAAVFGAAAARLANTSLFAIPGLKAETALIALDLDGVAVSSGAACSSGLVGRSHVLDAMGVSADLAACAIRASLGWSSTDADVDRLLGAFENLIRRLYDRRTDRVAA